MFRIIGVVIYTDVAKATAYLQLVIGNGPEPVYDFYDPPTVKLPAQKTHRK